MAEQQEQLNRLALDVLNLSRNTLLVNLRFLDMALSRLVYHSIENGTLLTDGKYLLYGPKHILRSYRRQQEISVRDYLHVVMHCVFRHMFMNPTLNRDYWDLACDIAVENMITELGLKSTAAYREANQSSDITKIKSKVGLLTAEKIYAYLRNAYPSPEKIAKIRTAFYSDDHSIWYMTQDQKNETYSLPQEGNNGRKKRNQSSGRREGDPVQEGIQYQIPLEYDNSCSEIASAWQMISERMQVDLETFGKQRGIAPGALTQNLMAVNREKYDYTSFLKKFAVMGEAMKINDDEFDYIFYTYGLQLYKKMPLIEPLEYKEIKAIKEFVIAIDTSGSTSGELVQKFVQKTFNILKSTESFFFKINLHIIQCDAELQEDKKITCQEDFDEYLNTMKIRGLGGTDFRPVFEYVDQLRLNKEFTNLKGLIYFTDGFGEFPARKPDYDTAFVFVDDEYNNPDVPPWAIKLVLQRDEI